MANPTMDALTRLANATANLLADMRERAIMRGDFDKEPDGRKVAILDCGNGVLFGVDGALDAARDAIAQAEQRGEVVAWVRFRSDGGIEGPIMDADSRMSDTRRQSGAWTPLYPAPPAPAVPDGRKLMPTEATDEMVAAIRAWLAEQIAALEVQP